MSGPPPKFSQATTIADGLGPAPIAVPAVFVPFKRAPTDAISRQLNIYPLVQTFTSSNSGQVVRFDLPAGYLLSTSAQGLELDFRLQITRVGTDTLSPISFPAERCGHLFNTARTFINNELIEETLELGFLTNTYGQATESDIDRSCMEQNIHAGYLSPNVSAYQNQPDGAFTSAPGYNNFLAKYAGTIAQSTTTVTGTTTTFTTAGTAGSGTQLPIPGITVGNELFVVASAAGADVGLSTGAINIITDDTHLNVTTSQTITGAARWGVRGDGYPVKRSGNYPLSLQQAIWATGKHVRLPLALPGQFWNQKKGLIPLHRLPKVRFELTLKPAQFVLWAPNIACNGSTGTRVATSGAPLGDYMITDMQIQAMYCQSPALAAIYDEGTWLCTILGFNYVTQIVAPGTSIQALPISMPYKSSRYIIGVFANPAQFQGVVGYTTSTGSSANSGVNQAAIVASTGAIAPNSNYVLSSTSATGLQSQYVDSQRWSSFYGLGGAYGGSGFGPDNSAPPLVGNDLGMSGPATVQFQINSESIFQTPLMRNTEFWRELTKVWPVRGSTFFNVSNFPGIRYICAINLQTPELADKFVCGQKMAAGQQLGFLNISFNTTDRYGNAAAGPIVGCSFCGWICHDRLIKTQRETGLTACDY